MLSRMTFYMYNHLPIDKWSSLGIDSNGLVISAVGILVDIKHGGSATQGSIHTYVEPR